MTLIYLLLLVTSIKVAGQEAQSLLNSGIYEEEVNGKLDEAILIFEQITRDFPQENKIASEALLRLGGIYEKLGLPNAITYYERLINLYPGQVIAAEEASKRIRKLKSESSSNSKNLDKPASTTTSELMQISQVPWNTGPLRSISPNGRFFTYSPVRRNLAVVDRISGDNKILTPDPMNKEFGREVGARGVASTTVWSPDSKKIAYMWIREEEGIDLRIFDLEADTFRILVPYDGNPNPIPLQWLPEGNILASISDKSKKKAELILIDAVSGESEQLIILDESDRVQNPRIGKISPSGRWIAYDVMQSNSTSDIYLMNLLTKEEVMLVGEDHSKEFDPLWLDDSCIVYFSNLSGTYSLWKTTIDENGSILSTEQLIEGVGWLFSHLGVTNQREYFYWSHVRIMNLYERQIDPETGEMGSEQLIRSSNLDQRMCPSYSPDGKSLLYLRTGNPETTKYEIREMETGREIPLNLPISSNQTYTYAPCNWQGMEGKLVFCVRNNQKQFDDPKIKTPVFETVIADINKRTFEVLANDAYTPTEIVDSVFYFRRNRAVLKYDLTTRREDTLYYESPYQVLAIKLSDDGKHLAIFRGEKDKINFSDEVVIFDTETNEKRMVWKSDKGMLFKRSDNWLSDNVHMMVEVWETNPWVQQFYILNTKTGERIPLGPRITERDNQMLFVDLHPSDQKIVYVRKKSSAGPWVVRNW